MIKKFLSKYILEVIPSIVATVVGAYIVTHYINAKPAADKPQAAMSAPAQTSKDAAPQALKADESSDKAAKAETAKAEAARLKAEKLALEKAAAERSAADRAENAKKAAEKLAAEKLASEKAAAEKRERTAAKPAPTAPMPAEANAAPDDKRDANDLARAAIERLRGAEQPRHTEPSRAQEAARVIEPSRPPERTKLNSVVYSPSAPVQPPIQSSPMPSSMQPSSIQPLPPAVTVAPAPSEATIMAPPRSAPDRFDVQADDSLRLTPPADIPSRPLDLHGRDRTSVADDVMSAAKSVFHAVVPDQR